MLTCYTILITSNTIVMCNRDAYFTPDQIASVMASVQDKVSKKYFDDQIRRATFGVYKGYYTEEIDKMLIDLKQEIMNELSAIDENTLTNLLNTYYE